jgi:hypothetical protein
MAGGVDNSVGNNSVYDSRLRQIKDERLERSGLKALGDIVYKGFESLVKGCVFLVEAVSDFFKENPGKPPTKLADDINRLFFDLPYRSGRDEGRTKQGMVAGVVINQDNARNVIEELKNTTDPLYGRDIREGLMAGLKYRYGMEGGIPPNIQGVVDRHFPQSISQLSAPSAGNKDTTSIAHLWESMPNTGVSFSSIKQIPREDLLTQENVGIRPQEEVSDIPGFVNISLDNPVTIGDMRVSLHFDDTIDKETGRPRGLVADIGDRQGVDVWNTYEDDESSENKAGMDVEFKNRQTTFRNLNGGEERLELSSGSWKLAKNALYMDEKTGKNWYLLESKKGDGKILVSTNDFTLPDTE